jgi:tight adherence protein C
MASPVEWLLLGPGGVLQTVVRALADPRSYRVEVLLWPVLFGLGVYLVATAQPLGRPKPDLAERLRRLDVDERLRRSLAEPPAPRPFASAALARLGVAGLPGLGGLAGGQDLERALRLVRPEDGPAQFFADKVVGLGISLGFFPLANTLGLTLDGPWPVWLWLVAGGAGYLAPDYLLSQELETRRLRALMELPLVLDLLAIAASAGQGLDQGIALVAAQGDGIVARELRAVTREVALGQRPLAEALEALAERNAIPELRTLVAQLRAADEQGIPLVQALTTQAAALREQKRVRLLEAGGRASVRMLFPVALLIFPVLLVVLLLPAIVLVMNLTG